MVEREVARNPRRPAPVGAAIAVPATAIGGAAGALVRAVLTGAHTYPATLAINITGTFALAFALADLFPRLARHRWLRPLLGTGFLGGFTTYSTVMVAGIDLGRDAAWAGAGYVLITVLAGLVAAVAGFAAGRWTRRVWSGRRGQGA